MEENILFQDLETVTVSTAPRVSKKKKIIILVFVWLNQIKLSGVLSAIIPNVPLMCIQTVYLGHLADAFVHLQ